MVCRRMGSHPNGAQRIQKGSIDHNLRKRQLLLRMGDLSTLGALGRLVAQDVPLALLLHFVGDARGRQPDQLGKGRVRPA